MRSINLLATVLAVSMLLAIAYISVQSNVQRYQAEVEYMSTVTHDQAIEQCEKLGLVYDYELETDYCIRPELYNQQQEGDL